VTVATVPYETFLRWTFPAVDLFHLRKDLSTEAEIEDPARGDLLSGFGDFEDEIHRFVHPCFVRQPSGER
jgi:hypothetical protein